MAEIAVNIVINKLTDQVTLLRGVDGQIDSVKGYLGMIKAYLKDADAKAETENTNNYQVKEWVKQVREIAYRIEDAIDEYLFEEAQCDQRCKLDGFICEIVHMLRTIIPRHKITSEIGDIKESIDELKERKEIFTLKESALESSSHGGDISKTTRHELPSGAHFIEDAHLVGVDHTRELLMDWLSKQENRRTVISVVGEGGLDFVGASESRTFMSQLMLMNENAV